jgi:hypothetical protein
MKLVNRQYANNQGNITIEAEKEETRTFNAL